uniref:CRAL-TRIO domain-containing protein n=1 Tax=Panagrolaimus sp. JU765 TaxID=591449 RepID=A0AC34RJW6_9BILA
MINLRKHRSTKPNRNSLMVVDSSSTDVLIQIVLNHGCFRNKDIGSLNAKDTLMVYNFLCSLLAFSEKKLGSVRPTSIVVLVDATRVPIKALRLVLKACQSALAFKMKQAVIVELDKFFDQQKLTLDILLENYDFKTTLCSKNKIWKYVNIADLADPFATRSTVDWTDLKSAFEDYFSQNPSYIVRRDSIGCKVPALSRFIHKDKSVLIELDASSGRYSRLFEQNDPIGQRILKNEPIYESIKPKVLEPIDKAVNVNEVAKNNVEETKLDVPTHLEPSKSFLEIVDGQKTAIKDLLEWINGPGTKWLQTLDDVGESIDETRQLLKQHQQLSAKTEQIVDQTAEIAEVVEFLLREKNQSEICESLKKLADELANAVHDFRRKVKQQTMIRSNSLRLHEILNEFYTESDILLKLLCHESKPMDQSETCQEELAFLESKMAIVEDRFEVASEICKTFDDFLAQLGNGATETMPRTDGSSQTETATNDSASNMRKRPATSHLLVVGDERLVAPRQLQKRPDNHGDQRQDFQLREKWNQFSRIWQATEPGMHTQSCWNDLGGNTDSRS